MVEEVDMSNGAIMEALNNKADIDLNNLSVEDKRALIEENKETIMGWMMPDYSAGISLSDISTSNPYTAPADGYLYATVYNCTAYVNDSIVAYSDNATYAVSVVIVLSKNDVVTVSQNVLNRCKFYPLKGAN